MYAVGIICAIDRPSAHASKGDMQRLTDSGICHPLFLLLRPRCENNVLVKAAGEVLNRDHALVQDWDVVVGFCACHAVGSEAFAGLSLDH